MFYRIACFSFFCVSLFSIEHVYLKTPHISLENMIGTNVGIRPFRKTGVRLEAEWFKDKLIIHSYGYGGSGLTLSFGGAQQVLDILDDQKTPHRVVAVLGAGVVGLATAYDLLEQGYEVHIYSDEWVPNLTSNVAAGVWSPLLFPADLPEEKKKLHQHLLKISENRFLKSTGESPEFDGVRITCAYRFKTQGNPELDKKEEEIIVHFDNGVIKTCRRAYELGIDGQVFIEDLYSKVKRKGAVLQQRHFASLEEILSLEEPILINCTSMGSSTLFNDQEFISVRGQIAYFNPQEGIDYLLLQKIENMPDDPNLFFVFIYPWNDRLILGGVYEWNQDEALVSPQVIDKIIGNAKKCLSGRL